MLKLYPFLFFSIFLNTAQAACAEDAVLGAHYSITSTVAERGPVSEKEMILWRSDHKVAHQYPASDITEIWERSGNGMLKLERHFDAYNRGIEYQPQEINNGKGERDWGLKSHLVSDELKNKMKIYDHGSGQACNKIEKYTLKEAGQEIELHWLPRLQLVKLLKVTKPGMVLQWKLAGLEFDSKLVNAIFNARAGDRMTDYIDIGDNESDPFLLKMMHLGSLQQGSSLVYQTRGRTSATQHGHHH